MSKESVQQLNTARRNYSLTADGKLQRLDVAELLAKPAPRIEWVWDGYLEGGTVAQLHGAGGSGKSLLMMALVRAMLDGYPFLGRETFPSRAVIIDAENPTGETHRRLERMGFAEVSSRVSYWQAEDAIFTDLVAAEELLCRHVEAGRADLLVIDSQRACWPGDENEATEVRPFYAMLRRVANATAACILVVHHDNKSGGYSGSGDLNNAVDSRLHLVRDEDGSITLFHEKLRSDVEQPPVRYRVHLEDGLYAFTLETVRTLRGDVLAVLDDEWRTAAEVAKAAGIRREDAESELWRLTRSGDAQHAVGPAGRSPKAKCWRTPQNTRDESGRVPAGELGDYSSPDLHTPRRGVESGRVEVADSSHTRDDPGRVDSAPSDAEVERLLQLGDDLGLTGGAA